MSKIRIASDLHTEFSGRFLKIPQLPTDPETTLILAGDICVVKKIDSVMLFFETISSQFKNIVYVIGNHEHYSGEFSTTIPKLKEKLSHLENIHVIEKESIELDGIVYIGATLWTNMNNHDPMTMFDAKQMMNDYRVIRHGPPSEPWKCKLTPTDTVADFLNAKHYIFEEIKKNKDKKIVVVTHHSMCSKSIHEKYRGDRLNGCYYSELSDDILDNPFLLHVHGHVHTSFDYNIGETRIICNPFGYANIEQNSDFDTKLLIEL